MKAIVFLLMLLLSVGLVSADKFGTDANVNVAGPLEGMSVKLYCNNVFVKEINVDLDGEFTTSIGKLGCPHEVKAELYYEENNLETVSVKPVCIDYKEICFMNKCVDLCIKNEANLNFDGIPQAPEFTTIGAALAMVGSAIAYKFKKKRI